jgi:hypothetical protein
MGARLNPFGYRDLFPECGRALQIALQAHCRGVPLFASKAFDRRDDRVVAIAG